MMRPLLRNDQATSGRFPDSPSWHALPPEACLTLQSSAIDGLGEAQAAERLKAYGPNRLPERRRTNPVLLFLRQFASPLIYLLLAGAVVSLYLDHRVDAAFIMGVLLLNAAIGAFQEGRADASARALRALIPDVVRVRREGALRELPSAEIVPGDIAELESGMRAMADMRLLSSQGLSVDESTLTGESLPVAKESLAVINADTTVADRMTMVHAGSTISGGRGIGLVVATGGATQLGAIGRSLELAGRASVPPLVRRMALLSRQIAIAAIALILLLSLLLIAEGRGLEEIFLLAVALAVSAIPEGLPVAVTVALAAATRRMAARQVIVRTLPAVEGLGACTLIASDKTGTLTINRLTVERIVDAAGTQLDRADWLEGTPTDGQIALALAAAICNEAKPSADGKRMTGDAVDVALMTFAQETGIDIKRAILLPRYSSIPYEPALRFAAVEAEGADGSRLYVKGAAETVLPMCAGFDPEMAFSAEILAAEGYRVLAIAEGHGVHGDIATALAGLRLLGFVGLADPLRPEVPDAIDRCTRAGVGVRMITGDHPVTARTIAARLGMACEPCEVVTGADLSGLDGETADFAERIASGRVFARIEPTQKLQIVQAMEAAGETVAVTGDGVNDAPALKAAAIGVAMGRNGTDVAREASDLIIADDNFASIVAGIEEARITFSNVRKIVMFVLATGIAEIGMFLGAVTLGLPMPLTALQLLWLNIVTNGVQDVMLGFGRGEGDELKQPPRGRFAPLIDRDALRMMLPAAFSMAVFALWLLQSQLAAGASVEEARNAVLLMTVLFQNVYVLSIRHLRHAAWRWNPPENSWLFMGVAAALLLHGSMMLLPTAQGILGIAPVNGAILLHCLAGALIILLVAEFSKAWVRMKATPASTAAR